MSWSLRFRVREHLRTALWPIPCASGLVGLLLGMLVWRFDRWAGWTLLDFEHAGATALTAAIVGATLTFLGTAFSVDLEDPGAGERARLARARVVAQADRPVGR